MFQKWFPLKGIETQEKKKQAEQPQEDKRKRESLRGSFIKNKRPLNPTLISLKKEK